MYLHAGEVTAAQPAECWPVQRRIRQHEGNRPSVPQITRCPRAQKSADKSWLVASLPPTHKSSAWQASRKRDLISALR
jgi:hypothetical protein